MEISEGQLKYDIIEAIERSAVEDARALLDRFRSSHGDAAEVAKLLAAIEAAGGDLERAEAVLAQAVASASDDTEARLLLAAVHEQQGDVEGAAARYAEAWADADTAQEQCIQAALQRLAQAEVRTASEGEAIARRAEALPRVALIVRQKADHFLEDLLRALRDRFDARKFVIDEIEQVDEAMRWGDICWFEWCDQLFVYGSRRPEARVKPVVCRLHRFEALTDLPRQVEWANVDRLVLVADHLRELLEQSVPDIDRRVRMEVIPNGVDIDRYVFRERNHGFRVALVGYLHLRKNPMMALQILRKLVDRDARYTLHVAGTFQDPLAHLYWGRLIEAMELERHVCWDGWQDDMDAWLEDKDYILSTSVHESFGYAIAEAMAKGIKPVVHRFPYAEEIWTPGMLFNTIDEAVHMIASGSYASARYRAFIASRYGLAQQVRHVGSLFDDVLGARGDWRTWNEVRPLFGIRDGSYMREHERPHFFMNPPAFFHEIRDTCSDEIVLQQTQNQFRVLVEKYVNGVGEAGFAPAYRYLIQLLQTELFRHVSVVQALLARLDLDGLSRVTEIDIEVVETTLRVLYPVLHEKLATATDEAHAPVPLGQPLADKIFRPEDARLQALYRRLQQAAASIESSIYAFLVHGSMSTLDYTAYSDVDTLVILAEDAFASEASLRRCREHFSRAAQDLFAFDPLQHHAFFFATEMDFHYYPESYLPLAVMKEATVVAGKTEAEVRVRTSELENLYALWSMGHGFRQAYLERRYPSDLFALKRYTSRLMLMPTLYLEALHGVFPYKRESFELARPYFSDAAWSAMTFATALRQAWHPGVQIDVNPVFYEQAFLFAEECLLHLAAALNDITLS